MATFCRSVSGKTSEFRWKVVKPLAAASSMLPRWLFIVDHVCFFSLYVLFSKSLISVLVKSLIVQLDHRYVELQSVFYVWQTHQRGHTTLPPPRTGPKFVSRAPPSTHLLDAIIKMEGSSGSSTQKKWRKNVTLMGLNDLCLIYNRSWKWKP